MCPSLVENCKHFEAFEIDDINKIRNFHEILNLKELKSLKFCNGALFPRDIRALSDLPKLETINLTFDCEYLTNLGREDFKSVTFLKSH